MHSSLAIDSSCQLVVPNDGLAKFSALSSCLRGLARSGLGNFEITRMPIAI